MEQKNRTTTLWTLPDSNFYLDFFCFLICKISGLALHEHSVTTAPFLDAAQCSSGITA